MKFAEILDSDYQNALYRKDVNGKISIWYATYNPLNKVIIIIYHGRLDGEILVEHIPITKKQVDEVQSRIKAKRKEGYKYLSELRDSTSLPSKEGVYDYCKTYLPVNRTTSDGITLPMLAKVYDNTNNKLFKNVDFYYGQYKINGLRCFIRAEEQPGLFNNYHLIFQSREGTIWNSLNYLENSLLGLIPDKLLEKMVHEDYVLDGELYIPGYSVNEINSAVKNVENPLNKLLQYWCYDIVIEDATQIKRSDIRFYYLSAFYNKFSSKDEHFSNRCPLVVLSNSIIENSNQATWDRDDYINLGFEGLIMRNPYEVYQFGKRNLAMIKYKRSTDGIFEILDIYPEGNKRSDLPLIKCKNDINNNTFECHLSDTFEVQQKILINKEQYIGKMLHIEFGERSGVNQVPFHIKEVKFYSNERITKI